MKYLLCCCVKLIDFQIGKINRWINTGWADVSHFKFINQIKHEKILIKHRTIANNAGKCSLFRCFEKVIESFEMCARIYIFCSIATIYMSHIFYCYITANVECYKVASVTILLHHIHFNYLWLYKYYLN